MFHDRLREYRQTLTGDFAIPVEAERFHKVLADEHPDELAEWLHVKVTQFIADELTSMLRRERAVARTRAGARAFADAADAHEAGDPTPLGAFSIVHAVNDDDLRRPVGDMTGADHRYVAGQYEVEGKRALTLKAFHLAVAKKVGMRRTADALDEADYDRMLASFLHPKGGDKAA